MNLELLTIGNELLLGHTVDTNAAVMARRLAEAGIRVVRRGTVGDEPESIRAAVREALERTGTVITTGGLGPTRDDLTLSSVAALFGLPLEFRDEAWQQVLARYRRFGRTPAETNRRQAELPRGADVLANDWGTAPGVWLEATLETGTRGLVIMLPGVPREMRHLLDERVLPRLAGRGTGLVVRSRTLRTSGVPESTLAEAMGDIEPAIAPLTLAYLPGTDGVDLRVTAWHLPATEAGERLDAAMAILRERAGQAVYGEEDDQLASLVISRARARKVKLATAESCTGGLLGARLTGIAGASEVYLGGIVAYANEAKMHLLGVPAELIDTHGAVSEPVARAMAEGAIRGLGADLAAAVTGVAGPGGGSAEKPVGTTWIATAGRGGTRSVKVIFGGDRDENRARAAQAALQRMARALEG